MNVGSLFSGAGLMDLGLARAGFEHAWFCESDAYCRRVLALRWPGVPVYEDVRTLEAPGRVDVLAGGFPCQDLSAAGRRAGIAGERSGLWAHFARLIRELRPRYVLVENVPGLLVGGMGRVLGDLAESGYDAEWDCLPAATFGAPHLRARIFILAYPGSGRGQGDGVRAGRDSAGCGGAAVAYPERVGRARREGVGGPGDPDREASKWPEGAGLARRCSPPLPTELRRYAAAWAVEPDVGRMAHGVPSRMDRLRVLGNGVVPQVAEWIGRRILEAERMRTAA